MVSTAHYEGTFEILTRSSVEDNELTSCLREALQNRGRRNIPNKYRFVAGGVPASDLDICSGAIQNFTQEIEQSFICRGIDRRRGYRDFEFGAVNIPDFISRSAWLNFQGQINAVIGLAQVGSAHFMK